MKKHYQHEPWVEQMDELLGIMGYSAQETTDSSSFIDFYRADDKEWEQIHDTILSLYGIHIHKDDYLWDVAEKMHDTLFFKKTKIEE